MGKGEKDTTHKRGYTSPNTRWAWGYGEGPCVPCEKV